MPYYDKERLRYLHHSGDSTVGFHGAVDTLLRTGHPPKHAIHGNPRHYWPHTVVVQYNRKYVGESKLELKAQFPNPDPINWNHSDGDVERFVRLFRGTPRFSAYPDREAASDRFELEFDFFERNQYILFLVSLHDLIQQFKRDNVIWGVGRGSSCASFILYCLEVHDIDPIEFDIPFKELSKETEHEEPQQHDHNT